MTDVIMSVFLYEERDNFCFTREDFTQRRKQIFEKYDIDRDPFAV